MRRAITVAVSAAVLPGVLTLGACSSSSSAAKSAGSATTAPKSGTSGASGTLAATAAPTPVGNIGLSQTQLIAAISTAANATSGVLVKGDMTASGEDNVIDMQLNEDGDASGTVGSSPLTSTYIVIGTNDYTQCSAALISMSSAVAAACGSSTDKWLMTPASSGLSSTSYFSDDTTLSSFLSNLTTVDGVTVVADGTGTLNGQKVAQYKLESTTDGDSILSLPVSGPALPIQLLGIDTNKGTVTCVWNQPVTITAPPSADVFG
jgi:hypothetical protein